MPVTQQEIFAHLEGAKQIGEFDGSDLVCRLYDNLYGIPIKSVQEIVPLPRVMPLPQLPVTFLGVCLFRENVIPVLNLAHELELTGDPPTPEEWQMVVIDYDNRLCAIAVEDIEEILNYSEADIEPLPSTSEVENELFKGIKSTQIGMVTLLNIDTILEQTQLPERLQISVQQATDATKQETERLALIRVGGIRVGVRIEEIERILRLPEIFPVDDAPACIRGVALSPDADQDNPDEEDYYPVLDMFEILEQAEDDGKRNLILAQTTAIRVGYFTGIVEEICDVSKADIASVPPILQSNQNDYIWGILKLEAELILLLDLNQILYACGLMEE